MATTVWLVKVLAVSCLLTGAAGIFLWSDTPFDIDDAPITYRYAVNVAAGNGFVYNRDERIQGTSTPLYTLLLASARWAGLMIPLTSNVIGFAASLAVVALTLLTVHLMGGDFLQGIVAGVILLCQASFLRYTMAGMETPLYSMFIMFSLAWLVGKHYALSAAAASLAALTRLDGLVIVATIWLFCLLHQKRVPLKEILATAIILGPWFVFAIVYFGSPLPLSMIAKQQHLFSSGASRYWIWEWLFVIPWREGLYTLPLALLGVTVSFRSKFEIGKWGPCLFWLAAYLIAYTIVGIPFYEWYVMPTYPIFALIVSAGLTSLGKLLQWVLLRRLPNASGVVVILLLVWLLPSHVRYAYSSVTGFKEYLLRVEGTRVAVGQWLRDNTPESSVVETGAIGHVGYVSNRYIIDSAGLVTPPSLLSTRKPDSYVLYDVPDTKKCGVVGEFKTGWAVSPESIYVARCVRP